MSEQGWWVLGVVSFIIITMAILILKVDGYFERFKKKK